MTVGPEPSASAGGPARGSALGPAVSARRRGAGAAGRAGGRRGRGCRLCCGPAGGGGRPGARQVRVGRARAGPRGKGSGARWLSWRAACAGAPAGSLAPAAPLRAPPPRSRRGRGQVGAPGPRFRNPRRPPGPRPAATARPLWACERSRLCTPEGSLRKPGRMRPARCTRTAHLGVAAALEGSPAFVLAARGSGP